MSDHPALIEHLRSGSVALRNYDSPMRTRITIRAGLLREVAADADAAATALAALVEALRLLAEANGYLRGEPASDEFLIAWQEAYDDFRAALDAADKAVAQGDGWVCIRGHANLMRDDVCRAGSCYAVRGGSKARRT